MFKDTSGASIDIDISEEKPPEAPKPKPEAPIAEEETVPKKRIDNRTRGLTITPHRLNPGRMRRRQNGIHR